MLESGAVEIAFIACVNDGVPGGPKKIPCNGWMATEPAPLTTAIVPSGATHHRDAARRVNHIQPGALGVDRCHLDAGGADLRRPRGRSAMDRLSAWFHPITCQPGVAAL